MCIRDRFHVGQKVTIEPQVYCGHCYPFRNGKYNLCEELKVMGYQTTGTASVSYTHLIIGLVGTMVLWLISKRHNQEAVSYTHLLLFKIKVK